MPLFLLAWPVALLNGTFSLTLAVFAGVYIAWALVGVGLGPADGKIAVVLAASAPLVLLAGVLIQAGAFLCFRLRGQRGTALPKAVGFLPGGGSRDAGSGVEHVNSPQWRTKSFPLAVYALTTSTHIRGESGSPLNPHTRRPGFRNRAV